jgi:hypothetical protein
MGSAHRDSARAPGPAPYPSHSSFPLGIARSVERLSRSADRNTQGGRIAPDLVEQRAERWVERCEAVLGERPIEPPDCGACWFRERERERAPSFLGWAAPPVHGASELPRVRDEGGERAPSLQAAQVGPWGAAGSEERRHFQPAAVRRAGSIGLSADRCSSYTASSISRSIGTKSDSACAGGAQAGRRRSGRWMEAER